MTKPTSKVIQISTDSPDSGKKLYFLALCEDGSIWSYDSEYREWECILEANND